MSYGLFDSAKMPFCCPKDCENRCAIPNCHETCEKYLTAKAEHEALKERIRNNARSRCTETGKRWESKPDWYKKGNH